MSRAPLQPDEWPASSQSQDNGGYNVSTRILSTAVILVALVVSLIAFIHLYARYVLHRRHLDDRRTTATINLLRLRVNSTAAVAPADETTPSSGLDPSAIAALPTFSYQKTDREESDQGSYGECAVCLSAVEEGETVRLLPSCKHLFHVGCIDMWLGSHSTCPLCRASVEPPSWSATTLDVGESSARQRPPQPVNELPGATGTSQEGTPSSSAVAGSKEVGSVSSRLFSLSFRRILSREKSSERRIHVDVNEDLERQRCDP